MTLSEEELSVLIKLMDKNPVVKKLWDEYKTTTENPYYDSYVTVYTQLLSWNQQLQSKKINLFTELESKAFERAHKYFTELDSYHATLDKIRLKMTPVEIKGAEQKAGTLLEQLLQETGAIEK